MLFWLTPFVIAQSLSSWVPTGLVLTLLRLLSLSLWLFSSGFFWPSLPWLRPFALVPLRLRKARGVLVPLSGLCWGLAHPLAAGVKANTLAQMAQAAGGLKLAAWLRLQIVALPPSLQPWLLGCILGERLDGAQAEMWRHLGLLHILVVSGMHVSLVASVLLGFVRLPCQLLYSLRCLQAGGFLRALRLSDALVVAAVWAYASATGFGSPVQRAVLVFSLAKFAAYFWGRAPLLWSCLLALTLQAWLFPYGFCSLATLMSWLAYMLVILCFTRERQSSLLLSLVTVNVILLLFSAAVFGGFSVFGVIANIFLVPATPFIFSAAFLLLAKPWLWEPFYAFLVALQLAFLQLCEKSFFAMERLGFSYLSLGEIFWLRGLYLCCALGLLLNFCWRESIREKAYNFRKRFAHVETFQKKGSLDE